MHEVLRVSAVYSDAGDGQLLPMQGGEPGGWLLRTRHHPDLVPWLCAPQRVLSRPLVQPATREGFGLQDSGIITICLYSQPQPPRLPLKGQ